MAIYTFRVQAVGGKFLADDIGGARIVIHDADTGNVLGSGATQGDSGTLYGPAPSTVPTTAQIAQASKNVVMAGNSVWWLVPDSGSSKLEVDLNLTQPKLVRLQVTGPLGGLQSAVTVRVPMWLSPNQAAPALPGYVIPLPGLLVYPIVPQIHQPVKAPNKIVLEAKVTMMCGCPVEGTAPWYWPPGDFVVKARVKRTSGGLPVYQESVDLPHLSTDPNQQSTFIADRPIDVPPGLTGTVFWEVVFDAFQKSTGNAGSATANFYCQY